MTKESRGSHFSPNVYAHSLLPYKIIKINKVHSSPSTTTDWNTLGLLEQPVREDQQWLAWTHVALSATLTAVWVTRSTW
ncbi:hypothetical protein CgunFtcFv8_014788 [Champsocephalus gunnari]|uniref:Uncharacterized protein n=1 Tax=Champsocephalus gunnari TaxID=52237 RepID=A0AAN8HZ20_CHAGU|nr:hypothetical protein CgunFtcFv8_014788 [Champsocephalus gunnari]